MTSWLFSSCQKRREGPESPRAVLIAVKKGESISGGWNTERMMRRYAAVTDQMLRAPAEAVSRSEWVNLSSAGQSGASASGLSVIG
jgi:hypothetical protein